MQDPQVARPWGLACSADDTGRQALNKRPSHPASSKSAPLPVSNVQAVAQTPSLRSAGSTSRAAAAAGASGPPLSRLDLSHNAAGPACVPAAVALLRGHAALRSLDLSYNDLGPEVGAQAGGQC